jgi:aminopeptidase N
MHVVDPSALTPALLHSLTHAWFRSFHVWLDEGIPQFISLLWTEQTQGREAALRQLQDQANGLSLAEPALEKNADPAQEGQSLIRARDEIYYRAKASAVLWMLRSIAGDDALGHALQLYRRDGKADADPKQFQHVLERETNKDLGWFFNDWVYRDRGLPDLSIVSVTPRPLSTKEGSSSWLVAVEVKNDGDAAAEIPVTVRSGILTSTQTLRVMGRSSASTRMVFQGDPEEVLVNDGSVPEMTASIHTRKIVNQ